MSRWHQRGRMLGFMLLLVCCLIPFALLVLNVLMFQTLLP